MASIVRLGVAVGGSIWLWSAKPSKESFAEFYRLWREQRMREGFQNQSQTVAREVGTLLQSTFGVDGSTASSLSGIAGWAGGQLADVTAAAFSHAGDVEFEYVDSGVVAIAVMHGDTGDEKIYFIGVANRWIYVEPELVQPLVQGVVYGTTTIAAISALRVAVRAVNGVR